MKATLRSDEKGFTLVEIALVMVIFGFLAGIGVTMTGALADLGKVSETRQSIETTAESIGSWVAGNNRIPPFKAVAPDMTSFSGLAQNQRDSWSNQLIYIFDANLSPTLANATKDTICGRLTTAITIHDNFTNTDVQNVAYAIVSMGYNNALDTTLSGRSVVSGPVAGNIITNSSLDIIRWVTLGELRSNAGCQGAQLKILNNELPAGSTISNYTATIAVDGGVPFVDSKATMPNQYRWCIQNPAGVSPVNMTFSTGLFSANCTAVAETSWPQAAQLNITWVAGTAPAVGSYPLTVFVRDNNDPVGATDNVASRSYVLTVVN